MQNYIFSVITGVVILVVAVPYVARIRHPEQRLFAAYLIFIILFSASAFTLFNALSWLAFALELRDMLDEPIVACIFLALVFVPSVLLASWQAAKPRMRQRPPE